MFSKKKSKIFEQQNIFIVFTKPRVTRGGGWENLIETIMQARDAKGDL